MDSFKELIDIAFKIFELALLTWVVISWIPEWQRTPLYEKLTQFFDPMLAPIRRAIPPLGGAFDISPIILIIAAGLIKSLLLRMI